MAQEHLNLKQTAASILYLLVVGTIIFFLIRITFEYAEPETHSTLEFFWGAVCFGAFMYKGFRVFLLFWYKIGPIVIQFFIWQAMFINAVMRHFYVSKYRREDVYLNLHMIRSFYYDAFKQSRYAEFDYDFFNYGEEEAERLTSDQRKRYQRRENYKQEKRQAYSDNPIESACMVLGINRADLDRDTLRTNYRRLAFKYHPDRNHTEEVDTTAKMQEISDAYNILVRHLDNR